MLEEFYKRDLNGDIDKIFAALVPGAPAVKQAKAKSKFAERDLDQAELDSSAIARSSLRLTASSRAATSIPATMSWQDKG